MIERASNILILLILIIGISFFPRIGCASELNQPSPALKGNELDGTLFDIATLKGKVVIVHFWATWCSACRDEMPILDTIYQKDHLSGLEILGMSIDRLQARDEVRKTISTFHFPTAMLRETQLNEFGFPHSLPLTYIIDRNNIIRTILSPETTPLTEQTLEKALAPLLKE